MFGKLLAQIEAAIDSRDAAEQNRVLRAATEFLMARWSRVPVEQRETFDELLLVLATKVDHEARCELAERMAGLRRAPLRTLAYLAADAADVATPILLRSALVDRATLERLSREASEAHVLAMAGRTSLEEAVTDGLVARAHLPASETLAANIGTRFSAQGWSCLVDQARRSERLTLRLAARADAPEPAHAELVALARARCLSALAEDLEDAAAVWSAQVLPAILLGLQPDASEGEPMALGASRAYVATQFASKRLSPRQIAAWADVRRTEDVIAGMSFMARMAPEIVQAAFAAPGWRPFVCIGRGLEFDWNSLKKLIAYQQRRELDHLALKTAYDEFQALAPTTARRIVRLAAARHRSMAFAA